MPSRNRVARVAKCLLGLLFFAQAALAAAACDWGQRAPAAAVSMSAAMPCCQDGESSDVMAENANLCLSHCTSEAQNVDTTAPAFPAVSTMAVLTVCRPAEPGRAVVVRRPAAIGFACAAPPLIILFQNFRI